MARPDGMPAVPALPRLRWREVVGATPRSVWAITVLFGLLLAAWSVIVPVYDAPDEPQHVDLVRMASESLTWPGPDDRTISEQVIGSMYATGFSWDPDNAFSIDVRPAQAADAVPRRERPAFAELGPDEPSRYRNQLVQHPPLYYWTAGTVLRLLPFTDTLPADLVVGLLRLGSVVFLLPLPVLLAAGARRLVGPGPVEPVAALLPATIPQFTHIGSVVSNDTLLVLGAALLTVTLIHVVTGDTSVRTGVWAGVWTAMALLVKGLALVLPLWVGLAYLVALTRGRSLRGVATPLAAAAGISAVGALWWLRNLLRYGVLQPRGYQPQVIPEGFEPRLGDVLDRYGEQMVQLFWGSFGWVEVDVPAAALWMASLVAVALVAAGFRARIRGGTPAAAVLLVPTLLIAAGVLYSAWSLYRQLALLTGMQGRYLFPGVPALCVLAAIGLTRLLGGRANWSPPLALLLVAAMQTVAVDTVLLHWYGPWGVVDRSASMAAMLGWNPWPFAATVTLGVTLACALVWTAVELGRVVGMSPTGTSLAPRDPQAHTDEQRGAPQPVGERDEQA